MSAIINLFGNNGETPVSPVIQTPEVSLGGGPGPIAVPAPIIFAGFGDVINGNVERYVDDGYSEHFCSIKKLENTMFDQVDKEYVTDKDEDKDETRSSWNDGNVGCGCDECFKSCIWAELPSGRTTIQKAADIAKNDPDDVELRCVHPYSLSIFSSVAQFTDKYERNVMFMDDITAMLFEDFMRIHHKLAKNSDTTSEWICLTGTFMLTNPKYALAYKTVYGPECCAHVMQHMLVHSENEYIVEMLRSMLSTKETC